MSVTISRDTLGYLQKLRKNNNKEWFDRNRPAYDDAREEFIALIAAFIKEISKFDPAVAHLDARKCVFRINRDIRFSNDKTPYKTNFSATISPGGKGSFTAGYYIHLRPGDSYLAGGMWQPEATRLQAIRQEIDYNADEFKKIIGEKSFKKFFGGLSDEDRLKTIPKGYSKDHPDIELLKNKSFLVVHELDDAKLLSKDLVKHCTAVFKSMYPLNSFLRRACD